MFIPAQDTQKDQKEKARIAAVNAFGIIIASMLSLYTAYYIYAGNTEIVFALLGVIFICLIPPVLNLFRLHNLARFVYNFNAAPCIYYHVFLIGPGMGIELFHILTLAYPFIFLRKEESRWMIFFFIYNMGFLFLTEFAPLTLIDPIEMSARTAIFVKASIFAFCSLHAGIFFYLYYRSIDSTEKTLTDAKNAAEKANKAKQDFLAAMSHEIRTPLNVVVSIANMLSEESVKNDKKLIESLRFSSDHLMNVINEILDFSKLEAGKIQLDKNPVNLQEFVQNIVSSYQVTAREKGLDLTIEIDTDIYSGFLVDEVRLNQILGNLLNNALKFTHQGSVKLHIALIEDQQRHQLLKFSVIDTGIGIPEGELSSIFSSFTQLSASITKKYGGSGLGLNIVVALLELHQSSLNVSSEPGKGSSFSFEITLEKSLLADLEEEKSIQLKPLNILVVDDYALNALIIKKTLSNWGMVVTTAESGKEAIASVMEQEYQLILMDIHMPEMDGVETTKRIRALNGRIDTPIYALT
ncbi:MAG: ATP-binding protein, partial [Bacteroidota bacterium]